MSKFLNLDDPATDPKPSKSIGGGLKKRGKPARKQADKAAVAKAGQAHGFTRATSPEQSPEPRAQASRRGRPPMNEAMTYWRIYIAPELRDELNALRDEEGRRLNDVLRDMLKAYKGSKT